MRFFSYLLGPLQGQTHNQGSSQHCGLGVSKTSEGLSHTVLTEFQLDFWLSPLGPSGQCSTKPQERTSDVGNKDGQKTREHFCYLAFFFFLLILSLKMHLVWWAFTSALTHFPSEILTWWSIWFHLLYKLLPIHKVDLQWNKEIRCLKA